MPDTWDSTDNHLATAPAGSPAATGGWDSTDNHQPSQDKPGFWSTVGENIKHGASEFASATGIPQMWGEAQKEKPVTSLKDAAARALATSGPSAAIQMGKGIAQNFYQHVSEAGGALKKGDISGALGHYAGSVPIFGPMAYKAGEQASSGDYAGAIGTAGGALTQAALPELIKRTPVAASAIMKPVKALGIDDPHSLMVRAVKPASRATGFPETLQRSMPELKASESALGKPIESVDDALAAIKIAKPRVWSQYEQMAGPQRAMGTTVDLNPVADAIENTVTSQMRLENPAQAQATMALADKYRARFPLQQAEDFVKTTNAELNSYYAKNPAARRVATAGNPDTAVNEAKATALRDAINKTLDDPNDGAAAREVKQRYGALMQLEDNLERRRTVAARQQPESLSEQIGKWSAAGQAVRGGARLLTGDVGGAADVLGALAQRKAASWLKEQQTTDALIRRAFKNYTATPAQINIPQQPTPAGLLNRGPLTTPPPTDPSQVWTSSGYPLPESRQIATPKQ